MKSDIKKIEKQSKVDQIKKGGIGIEIKDVVFDGNSTMFSFGKGKMRTNMIKSKGCITTEDGVLKCDSGQMYEQDGVIHLCPKKHGDSFVVYGVNVLVKSDTELVLDGKISLEHANSKLKINGYTLKVLKFIE